MKIKDLFDYKYGVNLELLNCQETFVKDSKSVNFVSRTSLNNGVVSRVKLIDGITPQKAGTLSLAVSGSVLSCFVQTEDYYSGRDLYVLTPKMELSLEQKLFYAMCINKNAYRYSYGRAANKTFPQIEIPELNICNKLINGYKIKKIKTNNLYKEQSLDFADWKEFLLSEIFKIKKSKNVNSTDISKGNDLNYISRTTNNNGVQYRIKNNHYDICKPCCISIGGETASVFYQDKNFITGNNITLLYNSKLNKYNGLFLVSIIGKEKYKYSYGRAFNKDHIEKTRIFLPAKDNIPDWEFMENYIKSLPYSDRI